MKKSISSTIMMVTLSVLVASIVFSTSAFALPPAVDLTGDWSGDVQVKTFDDSFELYCTHEGKMTASVTQNDNKLTVDYTYTQTNVQTYQNNHDCILVDGQDIGQFSGTISETELSLANDLQYFGHYTGEKIWVEGASDTKTRYTKISIQLSPVNFDPPLIDYDTDDDGILNRNDNCPTMSNPNQKNNENDDEGDVCDTDDDNDGIEDIIDDEPLIFSNSFSDLNLGGTTTGTINDRGDQTLIIEEIPGVGGVQIIAIFGGGVNPAVLSTCDNTRIEKFGESEGLQFTCPAQEKTNGFLTEHPKQEPELKPVLEQEHELQIDEQNQEVDLLKQIIQSFQGLFSLFG